MAMRVAASSDPHVASATVPTVPRPATGKTFVARARVALDKWEAFGRVATSQGTDRSKLLNEFINWYMRERGAVLPARASRDVIEQARITPPEEQA